MLVATPARSTQPPSATRRAIRAVAVSKRINRATDLGASPTSRRNNVPRCRGVRPTSAATVATDTRPPLHRNIRQAWCSSGLTSSRPSERRCTKSATTPKARCQDVASATRSLSSVATAPRTADPSKSSTLSSAAGTPNRARAASGCTASWTPACPRRCRTWLARTCSPPSITRCGRASGSWPTSAAASTPSSALTMNVRLAEGMPRCVPSGTSTAR